jgi:hypothetical protein
MIERRDLVKTGLAAAVFQVSGCGVAAERILRYRFTLRAAIGGEHCEGSSVHEMRWRPNTMPGSSHGGVYRMRFWAEAIALDLGHPGVVFGLLSPPANAIYGEDFSLFGVFPALRSLIPSDQGQALDREPGEAADEFAVRMRGEHALGREFVPALIRFRDINDRTTAESVRPENFASIFGAGARFEGLHIEITDAPVTHDIEQRLPWLSDVAPLNETLTGGDRYTAAISSQLNRSNFLVAGVDNS